MKNSLLIIVPAYNEAGVIEATLHDIQSQLREKKLEADIVVVDDGSQDETGRVAKQDGAFVLTHRRNCGLGAALMTGIEFAKRHDYQTCLTFDSDGQHDAHDIPKALAQLATGHDVVIGSRFLGSSSDMPLLRRILLYTSNWITWLFFGVKTTDSQSGFRAFSRRAITSLELRSNRMEVSSEFFGEIRRLHLRYCEIPIHIRYTNYSLQKGQSNLNSFNILIKLLYKVMR